MSVGVLLTIILGVAFILVGTMSARLMFSQDKTQAVMCEIIGCIIGFVCIGGVVIYLNTESGKRAIKDMQSEFNHGIHRTVQVYDINGELIKEYEGKFDVETGSAETAPYIVFDDENGKRHIIYYTTGTILIDEK